jgi:hypothetical protein
MDIDLVFKLYQYSIFSIRLFRSYRIFDDEVEIPNPAIFTKYIRLSKNGPLGGPAFATSLLDYFALTKDLRQDIESFGGKFITNQLKNIDLVVEQTGINYSSTKEYLEGLNCKILKVPELETFSRRLCKFPDKEGKQRVIAIPDYFSQTSLSNLHELLFSFLSELKSDFTFNQDKFLELIPVIGDNINVN